MWVKSQDNRILKKCDSFCVEASVNRRKYAVLGNGVALGEYKSEEEALKVLDLIYGCIKQSIHYFHMP